MHPTPLPGRALEAPADGLDQPGMGIGHHQADTAQAPVAQAEQTVVMLLSFAERNPGMTRVLIGDALVHEDERLQARINQLTDKLEAALRQSLRIAQAANGWHGDASADAAVLISYVIGRWQLFAKTGFKRVPQESWDLQRKFLFG